MFERPSSLNKLQSKVTLSGHPIKEIPWTLPYFTESICPACRKTVKARKFVEDGKVFMIILGSHDAYNFDMERAKRGVFHMMAKDGKITMLT